MVSWSRHVESMNSRCEVPSERGLMPPTTPVRRCARPDRPWRRLGTGGFWRSAWRQVSQAARSRRRIAGGFQAHELVLKACVGSMPASTVSSNARAAGSPTVMVKQRQPPSASMARWAYRLYP